VLLRKREAWAELGVSPMVQQNWLRRSQGLNRKYLSSEEE
jgi:hypothetical protein